MEISQAQVESSVHPAETRPLDGRPSLSARFTSFCAAAAQVTGSAKAFIAALLLILAWGITGPYYHYSDTWQLVINTATNLITFIMVFLIQNTQNRDAKAINLKLNEVIHSITHASNEMIDIERLSDEELDRLDKHYSRIREAAQRRRGAHRQTPA